MSTLNFVLAQKFWIIQISIYKSNATYCTVLLKVICISFTKAQNSTHDSVVNYPYNDLTIYNCLTYFYFKYFYERPSYFV